MKEVEQHKGRLQVRELGKCRAVQIYEVLACPYSSGGSDETGRETQNVLEVCLESDGS